jgi:hypothetical protein
MWYNVFTCARGEMDAESNYVCLAHADGAFCVWHAGTNANNGGSGRYPGPNLYADGSPHGYSLAHADVNADAHALTNRYIDADSYAYPYAHSLAGNRHAHGYAKRYPDARAADGDIHAGTANGDAQTQEAYPHFDA